MFTPSRHTRVSHWRCCFAALAVLGVALPAVAQAPPGTSLPAPRLFVLTPPGGKAGTIVEVAVTGLDLEEPQGLLFSHVGIKAEPIIPPPPPPPDPKKPPPAPMPKAQITRFKVTIPADVPPSILDVRLVNKYGISNPRAFVIGDLEEAAEKEPNNDVNEAQRVNLNTTINGAFQAPTDVDYYVFSGKKGQRVLCSCLATSIDSRAHPFVEVYDARGRLHSSKNYHHNDALADVTLPEDGDYHVRVFEFTHTQGTPEHFYRLSITTAPWIDAVHPSVIEPGKTTSVTVYGRNLPGGKLDPAALDGDRVLEKVVLPVTAPSGEAAERLTFSGILEPASAALDGFEYRLRNDVGTSNPFLMTLARAPVVLDNEANDTPDTAQEITPPCEIAGHIEKRRDRDWYVFTAKKGDAYLVEVLGERLGSPIFPYFFVRAATEKAEPAESQDNVDFLHRKFFVRTEDPLVYRFVAPADGKYQLLVGSQKSAEKAGPRHYYRLRIMPEAPDFRLVAMPASDYRPEAATLWQAGQQSFSVFVLRQDGFTGDVSLSMDGLPAGVSCAPTTIGGDVREIQLVVSAAPTAAAWTGEVKVKGTATIRGRKVVREARAASIVWPVLPMQNIPTLTRLDRGLLLAVRDKAPYAATAALDKNAIVQGDKGTLKVTVVRNWPEAKSPITFQAMATELPKGLLINNNQPININPDKTEASLPVIVPPTVVPGIYTIVLETRGSVPYTKDPMGKNKQPVQVILPTTPVTLTIIPKALATVVLPNPGPTVKVGTELPFVVRVNRMFNYDGEFKVEVVLPPGTAGLEAASAVIPAGKDEASLPLKAAAAAVPGNRGNLTVKVTATAFGTTVLHEMKFNVNIVK
jgi:hypothetical protein